MSSNITPADLAGFREGYRADPMRQAMTRVLYTTDISKVICRPDDARKMVFKFSTDIKTMKSTNQKSSGRCWLFAATNVLREHIAKELNLEDFELSQSYMAFWDKFERCNYFFEAILETAGLPLNDRTVNFLLQGGLSDGGQWDMFTSLVRKYGVVPKDAMPETFQTSNTRGSNQYISKFMRKNALSLRKMAAGGASREALEAEKKALLAKCFSFLSSCYGEPPETFDFEYVDKDKNFHRESGMTPLSFRDKYLDGVWDDYVSLIHAPTADKPFDRLYTIKYLGNVAEDKGIRHVNLTMEELKAAVLRQLQDGEVVWFGSDCGKFGDRDSRFWDDQSFDSLPATGLDVAMTKEEMLDCCDSAMNHAMCFTGVNIGEDGKPNRWKIENSWGSEGLNEGYYMASDSWFDLLVYQAVVHKKYLGDKAAILDTDPIVLDPWDPIGSLAD
ncbi:MAG: C1 family peptidase [Oscillospiraceae bacterium]|nr:C1 family peptidase [Oscillospiraceae bacterium]